MKVKIKDLNPNHVTVLWCDMQTENYHANFKNNVEEAEVQAIFTFETPQVFWDYMHDAFDNPLAMWYWIVTEGRCICSGACDPVTDPDIIREYFEDAIDYGDDVLFVCKEED